MTPCRPVAAALALAALLAPAARAENASATLLAGDILHGNIATPGDGDRLSLYLPGGTVLSVDALAEPGSAIHPSLEVRGPSDAVLDIGPFTNPGPEGIGVRVKKAPIAADAGGLHAFRVAGADTTSGKYVFRTIAKMPTRASGTPTISPGFVEALAFDAPAGTKLRYAVKRAPGAPEGDLAMQGLGAPDGSETPLTDLQGSGISLDQDGTWEIRVRNVGEFLVIPGITVSLTLPKSKSVLYLSPFDIGPAPRVRSVTPKKVLNDRPAPGMAVSGEGFDPAASVRLERAGEDSLSPSAFSIAGESSLTADFDVTGARPGTWRLVVVNPSGGAGIGKLTVRAAGKVKLPPGAQAGTEVWWIDFDRVDFRADLDALGLGCPDETTAAFAEAAVKSYALYWARKAFGRDPLTGKAQEGGVPASFVLARPPAAVGSPGAGYDRLSVGGEAAPGDPSSNPNLAWGDGPLDAGNTAYDDVSPDAGTGRGLKTRALAPSLAGSIALYYDALKPLRDRPLVAPEAIYFLRDFVPRTEAEGQRYRDIAAAVQAAGKEIGGAIAHFVARAMGTPDGSAGLASLPAKSGEYAALAPFAFTQTERDALAASARAGLPGTAKTLRANYFPYREALALLLPDATTTQPYAQSFDLGGGRPDREPGDLKFTGVAGSIPSGFTLETTGALTGTAPLRNADSTLVGGVYRFLVRMKDQVTGEEILFGHRLNLLVDTADPALSPAEVQLGNQLNTQTLSTP